MVTIMRGCAGSSEATQGWCISSSPEAWGGRLTVATREGARRSCLPPALVTSKS
jgi:hypothetical protein